jgi:hypothetical protein
LIIIILKLKKNRENIWIYNLCFGFYIFPFTTRFHSFTDGNIPSVCDLEFVGNFFTDGKRLLAFLSSVIPNSVAKSVGKKKKLPMVLQREIAREKKNSRLKYTDGCIPSVIVAYPVNIFQLPVKCRRTISLCEFVGEW